MAKVKFKVHGAHFDSVLRNAKSKKSSLGNCKLTIQLRIHLVRRDVESIERKGKTEACRPWTDEEWKHFRRQVEKLPERHFNNRFWLVPPRGFADLDYSIGKAKYRPRVKCDLNIVIVDSKKTRRHRRIRVVHLAENNEFMRSHSRLYDHRDIEEDSGKHKQITVVHEIGHALKLDHPGLRMKIKSCLKDGNRDECYKPEKELMADGMTMIPEYAKPWQTQIARHTGTKASNWRVLMRPEPAEPLSMIDFRNKAEKRMRDRLIRSIEGL